MKNELFAVDEVREAAKKLDMSDKGSDEEYINVLLAEYAAFAPLRKRAMLVLEMEKRDHEQ